MKICWVTALVFGLLATALHADDLTPATTYTVELNFHPVSNDVDVDITFAFMFFEEFEYGFGNAYLDSRDAGLSITGQWRDVEYDDENTVDFQLQEQVHALSDLELHKVTDARTFAGNRLYAVAIGNYEFSGSMDYLNNAENAPTVETAHIWELNVAGQTMIEGIDLTEAGTQVYWIDSDEDGEDDIIQTIALGRCWNEDDGKGYRSRFVVSYYDENDNLLGVDSGPTTQYLDYNSSQVREVQLSTEFWVDDVAKVHVQMEGGVGSTGPWTVNDSKTVNRW